MGDREVLTGSAAARRAELKRLRRLARMLDAAVHVPGTRFFVGLDSILGLVPGVGDWTMALASLYIVHRARLLGARRRTLGRMLGAVFIDAAVGTIPVLGDFFDAAYRANLRIVSMLEEDLLRQDARATRGEPIAGARRPSRPFLGGEVERGHAQQTDRDARQREADLPIRGRGAGWTSDETRSETEDIRDRVVERKRGAGTEGPGRGTPPTHTGP